MEKRIPIGTVVLRCTHLPVVFDYLLMSLCYLVYCSSPPLFCPETSLVVASIKMKKSYKNCHVPTWFHCQFLVSWLFGSKKSRWKMDGFKPVEWSCSRTFRQILMWESSRNRMFFQESPTFHSIHSTDHTSVTS